MENDNAAGKQLAVRSTMTLDTMREFAKDIAKSGMFGIRNESQAVCLMAICQAEGIDPIAALRRYHLIEGKPSMRADAMLAEYLNDGGAVLWHIRMDDVCSATFFRDKSKIDDAARKRADDRFRILFEADQAEEAGVDLVARLAELAREGEDTIFRTFADCQEKGITVAGDGKTKANWERHPREMLTARVASEGVRLSNPAIVTGVYTPEELQDAVALEPAAPPASRDLEAMEKMLAQYEADAKEATGARKQELLGLASDMRCKIEDYKLGKGSSTWKSSTGEEIQAERVPRLLGESEARATDVSGVSRPIQSGASQEDETPFGGTQGDDRSPEDDQLDLTPTLKWEDYALERVKAKQLRGRKLGSFTPDELEVIYLKTKNVKSDDPEIQKEARYIRMAFEATRPKEEPIEVLP